MRRVVLEDDPKRDYQRFLQAENRGAASEAKRPMRGTRPLLEWAQARQLPYDDGHVHLPDARLEDEGRMAAARLKTSRSSRRTTGAPTRRPSTVGFTRYRAAGARWVGARDRQKRAQADARLAEELLP